MLVNTTDLPDYVANLKVMFQKGFGEFIDESKSAKQFYQTLYMGPGQGMTFRVEEQISARAPAKVTAEGDNFRTTSIAPGYYKDVTVRRITTDVAYTWQWEYHNKYPSQINNLYNDCGRNLRYRIELDSIHRLSFGVDTSMTDLDGRTVDLTVGDGFQLFYSAHTLTSSTRTYRNRLAGNPAIAVGTIEQMITNFNQQTFDNKGTRFLAYPTVLLVGSDETQYNAAKRLFGSSGDPEGGHSGVLNPILGTKRVIQHQFLDTDKDGYVDSTKSAYAIMIDTSQALGYLVVTENPTVTLPTIANGGIVFSNENREVKGSSTYEHCILNPRAVQMTSGDGQA
jgi:hypothetical protein